MSAEESRASRLELGLVLLGLLAVLSVFAPTADQVLATRDHGVHLARAVQIDLGRHPFVDYPGGVYGPLVFYLSYLGQALGGWTLLGEVLLNGLGHALAYLLLFAVCRRIGCTRTVALAALVAGVLLMPRFYKYYIALGPAFYLFALESGCRRGFRPASLALLALATCVTGFFRLDYGAYAVAVSLLAIVVAGLPAGGRALLRTIAAYAGFGLLFAAPFLLLLVVGANPVEVLRDTLALVGGAKGGLGKELDVERYAWTRFQFAFWGFRILPWVLLAACFLRWRRFEDAARRTFLLGASAFTALVFVQATHRIDPQHLLQVLPPALVLVAWLAGGLAQRLPRVPGLVCALVLLAVPVLLMGDRRERFGRLPTASAYFTKWGELPATRAELREGKGWDRDVATWITENAPAGDVLVLPYWPQLYYLAERGYGTPFGWLWPGVFGARFTEAAFLERLADTRVVVDEITFAFDRDPSRGLRAFAPELMRALYQERAIVYAQGNALVLSDEPALVSRARAPGSFRPFDREYASGAAGWFELDSVNTLPWDAPEPQRTIRGGALLLSGRLQSTVGEGLWVVLSGDSTFRARAELRRARGGPVFHCMADTQAVPPGVYAVEVATGSPASGRRTPTGHRVEVVELP